MQAVSIHVVDVANGVVAVGMRVDIVRNDGTRDAPRWTPVVTGNVGRNGLVDIDGRERLFEVGEYEMRLHIADYYRARPTPPALPEPAFMEQQVFRFGLSDLSLHYHLPVKLTPWGLSCFRGAA